VAFEIVWIAAVDRCHGVEDRFLGDDFAVLRRGLRDAVDSKEEGLTRSTFW
jgi:hypothetical protein